MIAAIRHTASGLVSVLLIAACGDRAPPALWPEPPPPTLAKPIGVQDPQGMDATEAAARAEAEAAATAEAEAAAAAEADAAAKRAKLPRHTLGGAESGDAESGGAESGGAESGGSESGS